MKFITCLFVLILELYVISVLCWGPISHTVFTCKGLHPHASVPQCLGTKGAGALLSFRLMFCGLCCCCCCCCVLLLLLLLCVVVVVAAACLLFVVGVLLAFAVVCTCILLSPRLDTRTRTHTHTHAHTYTHTRTHIHTMFCYTDANRNVWSFAWTHRSNVLFLDTHTHMLTCSVFRHTHTCSHALFLDTHTHTHRYFGCRQ